MCAERRILVRASVHAVCVASLLGALLSGCGQKGGLYLPNDPDFKQRATLPDIVRRQFPEWPGDGAGAEKPNAAPATQTAPASTRNGTPANGASPATEAAKPDTPTPATPTAR